MKAMVLAAGLGTRLRPLTNDRPKALVEINGHTLLEITLARFRTFGVHDVIVNVHHFADEMESYLKANQNFGMHIEISREDILLDTGGGLKKAAWFFLSDTGALEPFVLHNVDVLSNVDLNRMLEFHNQQNAVATLAIQDRKTSRYLLFDKAMQLSGRRSGGQQREEKLEMVRHADPVSALAFSGIHIISPRLLPALTEDGVFSIINSYLRLAGQGERVLGFRADEYYWRDLGTPQSLAQAALDLQNHALEG